MGCMVDRFTLAMLTLTSHKRHWLDWRLGTRTIYSCQLFIWIKILNIFIYSSFRNCNLDIKLQDFPLHDRVAGLHQMVNSHAFSMQWFSLFDPTMIRKYASSKLIPRRVGGCVCKHTPLLTLGHSSSVLSVPNEMNWRMSQPSPCLASIHIKNLLHDLAKMAAF